MQDLSWLETKPWPWPIFRNPQEPWRWTWFHPEPLVLQAFARALSPLPQDLQSFELYLLFSSESFTCFESDLQAGVYPEFLVDQAYEIIAEEFPTTPQTLQQHLAQTHVLSLSAEALAQTQSALLAPYVIQIEGTACQIHWDNKNMALETFLTLVQHDPNDMSRQVQALNTPEHSHAIFNQCIVGLGQFFQSSTEQAAQALADLIQHLPQSERFVILGDKGSSHILWQILSNTAAAERCVGLIDEHEDYDDFKLSHSALHFHRSHYRPLPEAEWVFLFVPPERQLMHQRLVARNLATPKKIVLPQIPYGMWPQKEWENPLPLALYLFPCAGTGRLMPPINQLLQFFGFKLVSYPSHCEQAPRLSFQHSFSQEQVDRYYQAILQGIDYYQYTVLHDPVSVDIFAQMPQLRSLLLIRDPRDLLISYYFREFGPAYVQGEVSSAQQEAQLLSLMEKGFIQHYHHRVSYWPNLQWIAREWVKAQTLPNTLTIRFEDLHHQEEKTYQTILNWLGLNEHPLIKLQAEALKQAIYLGSFEYQTQGKRKRGAESKENFVLNGQDTPCRKGITGDWKNYFTPRLIERCQDLLGPELQQLGYAN